MIKDYWPIVMQLVYRSATFAPRAWLRQSRQSDMFNDGLLRFEHAPCMHAWSLRQPLITWSNVTAVYFHVLYSLLPL